MRQTINFNDYLRDSLRDPEEAQAFLELIVREYEEDKDTHIFLKLLRLTREAQGSILPLAENLHLNRSDFYTTLNENSHLKPEAINTILHELGFNASTKPVQNHDHHVTH